jgi:ubiquinone/menaquinone biosynthesis C-methylase UbiE
MDSTRLVEFGSIDRTGDPGYFIRFLDAACAESSFQAYKRRANELLEVGPGRKILDVGCGTGDDCRDMARLVGPAGRVVGLDNSQAMVAEAERRAAGGGLPVEFLAGDAMNLPFPDGDFDGVRADRSPMHVPDPRRLLAEMARVCRPGGKVVVYEVDFETLVVDAADKALARKVAHAWCDSFRDGWLGRRMPGLFADAGLADVSVTPCTLVLTPELAWPVLGPATTAKAVERGALGGEEERAWLAHLEALRQGRFFCTLTGFLVCGRR